MIRDESLITKCVCGRGGYIRGVGGGNLFGGVLSGGGGGEKKKPFWGSFISSGIWGVRCVPFFFFFFLLSIKVKPPTYPN